MTTVLDLYKLKRFMIVDTYEEMCNLLGDDVYDITEIEKRQQQEYIWKSNFAYEKRERKGVSHYIIYATYDNPIPLKYDENYKKELIYYIEKFIMHKAALNNNIFSSVLYGFYMRLGMTSISLFYKDKRPYNIIDITTFYKLKKYALDCLKNVLYCALDDLCKNKDISVSTKMQIHIDNINDFTTETIDMNTEQEEFVRKTENALLKKYKCRNIDDICIKNVYNNFYKESRKLFYDKYGFEQYFEMLIVKYNKKDKPLVRNFFGLEYTINTMFANYFRNNCNICDDNVLDTFINEYILNY